MKNKIIYGVLAVIFIISIVLTLTIGLNVDLYYGEGYTIKFTEKTTIETADVETIVKEIWGNEFLVQRIEFFNDSAVVKVKEIDDEKIQKLCDKLNEKYSSELETSSFRIEHVANVKLRNIVEPYIIPAIISLAIILLFYAIRYKGVRQMLELVLFILIGEGILYSVYAICRVPISTFTMPVAISVYVLIMLEYTLYSEKKLKKENENNT